jgi:hypothetical protein
MHRKCAFLDTTVILNLLNLEAVVGRFGTGRAFMHRKCAFLDTAVILNFLLGGYLDITQLYITCVSENE